MRWIVLFSILAIGNNCKGISNIPRVSVYPCNVPVAEKLFSICCKTENIYTSTVYIYKDTANNIMASVKHPCYVTSGKGLKTWNCQSFKQTRILKIYTTRNASNSLGIWGCKFYGGISTYNLTANQVVTHDGGYQYVDVHSAVTLTWKIKGNDYSVMLPDGSPLVNSGHDYSVTPLPDLISNEVKVRIRNVSANANGTYICMSENNKRRDALTLIILGIVSKPSILDVKVSFSGQYMTANLTCDTNSKSAGPPFYIPSFNTSWLYSTTAAYKTSVNGKYLIIKNLDCNVKHSRPVFCALKEGPGAWSQYGYLHPHMLCSLKPTTAPAANKEETTSNGLQTAGIVLCIIWLCIFLFIMVGYIYCKKMKRRTDLGLSRCEACESCCAECCDNMSDCWDGVKGCSCCKRCRKDSLDDIYEEPDTQDIPNRLRRTTNTNDDDLQHILDLYRITEGTHIPGVSGIQNHTSNTNNSRNDEVNNSTERNDSNNVGTSDVVLYERNQSSVATGLNKPALVLELETCLQNLSKLVNSTENQVQVRRSHIIEDMFNIYTDPDILHSKLHVKLVGEDGSDWGGVSRDVFTTFWNEASSLFFQGDSVHVPYLPLVNMGNENKFLLLGRILTHSTAILGFFPVKMSKSSMMVIVYNSTEIEENALIEDFLCFLDVKDRQLIQEAINDYSSLSEDQVKDIQELFFRYEMGCMLRQDSFRSHLLKIARNELCVKPRVLCEKIRQGIPEDHFDAFWCHLTVDHIDLLHARLQPSSERVLNCLQPSVPFGNLTRRRRRVYEFFQEFIEKLNTEDLQLLLQLITGQSCIPKRPIQVEFSELGGVQRRPVFHTCSYMIELPDTYRNYEDLEREMTNVLHSDVLKFDIA